MTLKAADNNLLRGFVYVTDGVTLTIEPGTVIKGEKSSKGSLIVERGGKLIAEGTAEKPIVFTSDQPKASRTYGDWGGLILCGKSIVNNTAGEAQIEGGPRSYYGGKDPEDNSGIVKYVRIEFAGYPLEPNKEINGLTCGGVGRGTTIEYVQVSFCGDDSFEWFGGTVNAKHLIAYKGWDDEFDTDYGFQGKLQFLLGVRDPKHADTSKSNGFESDNDADGSNNTPLTTPVFSNVTLIGPFYGESAGKTENDIFYVTEDAANGAKAELLDAGIRILQPGDSTVVDALFRACRVGETLPPADVGAELRSRREFVSAISDKLVLETPDPVVDTEFRFAKIRAAFITMEYGDNRYAVLEYGSAFHWPEHYVLIQGTEGAIRLDMFNCGGTLKKGDKEEPFLMHKTQEEDDDRTRIYHGTEMDGAIMCHLRRPHHPGGHGPSGSTRSVFL